MKKIYIMLLFVVSLHAQIIDGVAIKVNGNTITLYEIDLAQEQLQVDRQKAIETIIFNKLRENEIKRLGINVDENRINDEINNIVANNKITMDELHEALKAQGLDFDTYKQNLKDHIVNRELMQRILQANTNLANENDLRQYYETHKNEFMIPTKIRVTSYISSNDAELQKFLKNPMLLNPNIESRDEEIDIKNLPQQIVGVFLDTPERRFTPILNSGSTLIVFFIKEKLNEEVLPFEDIKSNVMYRYSQAREEEILKDYFGKIRANTDIEIVRE